MKLAQPLKTGLISIQLLCTLLCSTELFSEEINQHQTQQLSSDYCSPVFYKDDSIEHTLQDLHQTTILINDPQLQTDITTTSQALLSTTQDGLVNAKISYTTFDKNIQTVVKKLIQCKQKIQHKLVTITDPDIKKSYAKLLTKITFVIENVSTISKELHPLVIKYKPYAKSNKATKLIMLTLPIKSFKDKVDAQSGNKFVPYAFIKKFKDADIITQIANFFPVLASLNKETH